jgi:hypothetical protein
LKTIGIAALALVAALILGFGARLGTQTAHAEADASVAVGCEFLMSAIDGTLDDETVVWADPPTNTVPGADLIDACFDGIDADDVANLANVLGDEDDVLEASDFDDIEQWGGNQVQDGGTVNGTIHIFAFVDNDGTVTFDATTGGTIDVNDDGCPDNVAASGNCGAGETEAAAADTNDETCGENDNLDLDCGTSVLDNGDGVVVATFTENGDAGDDVDVDVFQADDIANVQTETILIMGVPHDIALDVLKSPIQTSGSSTEVGNCEEDSDVSDATQLADLNRTFLKATVIDEDENELTRIAVDFEVDDEDIATFDNDDGEDASDPKSFTGVSVDAGAAGIGSFLVLCGGTDTGTVTVTATETVNDRDADAEVDVVGEPANVALTASPAAVFCDGAATSTVSATVTDSEGNNVANGSEVNFSVVALGTANPINATTTDGVATSTITPLSGAVAGVTVIVTAGDAQASIRIDCNTPAAATATPGGPAATPPGGGISGPDTGNGGYLAQDSAGFPMWTLVALALGSLALVTGGLVTRRVGR